MTGQIDGSGTARARCLLAPNPSPMTLDGTNTWLIAEPGSEAVVVVDPGPGLPGHLNRVRDEVASAGQRVALILLTHGHPDHAEGAAAFAGLTGAPVRAADPAHRLGGEGLAAGDVVTLAGCELRVVATPGHTADSVSFLLPADGALLTDPAGTLDFYLAHRRERLAEVTAALAAGDRTPAEIVARVYLDVDRSLWPFAEWSVRAQLDYLASTGALPPGVSY